MARDGWEKVEAHTVPGLAVYLVPDRKASTASEGTPSTSGTGTTPLFRDDRGVPGVDGDHPEAKAATDQLRFDFNRDPGDPNQHSLIEDGRLEPALESS